MEHAHDLSDDGEFLRWDLKPLIECFYEFAANLFSRVGRRVYEGFQ
jgi:hypothetical protein